MIKVRFMVLLLGVILAAGETALGQQQTPLTPTTAALRLNSDKKSYDYADKTQTIALGYWRHGDYKSAFAQIDYLEPREQEQLLLNFVFLAIKAKQTDPARSALNRALKLVMSVDEDSRNTGSIAELARNAVEVDDLELASRFTNLLDEGSARKAFALVSLAEVWASRNERARATALLDEAMAQTGAFDEEERDDLIDLYGKVVQVLINLDEKDRATDLANRANELFLSQQEPDGRDRSAVALSFARLGDLSRAMLLMESVDDDYKIKNLVSLAGVYQTRDDQTAALNSLLRARAILESTSADGYAHSTALNHLASGYLKLGRPDEAFEVMRGISDPFYLGKTASEVADSFFAQGRRQEATAALTFAYSQIRNIVSEKSGDIPSSASGSNAQTKSHRLTDLGEKFLEFRDLHGAEAAARAIDHPQYKASLLAKVAVGYAREGDKSKAQSLLAQAFQLSSNSSEYNHDSPREYPLVRIAEAYADAGFKQDSRNVILRLVRELRDGDHDASTIECLIEVGLMAETKGVPIDLSIQTVLMQVIKKAEDN